MNTMMDVMRQQPIKKRNPKVQVIPPMEIRTKVNIKKLTKVQRVLRRLKKLEKRKETEVMSVYEEHTPCKGVV